MRRHTHIYQILNQHPQVTSTSQHLLIQASFSEATEREVVNKYVMLDILATWCRRTQFWVAFECCSLWTLDGTTAALWGFSSFTFVFIFISDYKNATVSFSCIRFSCNCVYWYTDLWCCTFWDEKQNNSQRELPVVKGPSEMKNDPTVRATAAANLKNQNLWQRQSNVKKIKTLTHT